MKGMKKLFALLAVLTMALTLMPMVTPVAAADELTVEINGGSETGTVMYGTSATTQLKVTGVWEGTATIDSPSVTYRWFSYNESVATASPTTASTTTLAAKAVGTTKVRVEVSFGSLTGAAEYTVEVKPDHVITIEPSQTTTVTLYTKNPGMTATLGAVVKLDGEDVSNLNLTPTISWTASPAGAIAIFPPSGNTSVIVCSTTTTPTSGTITISATVVPAGTSTTATRSFDIPFKVKDHELTLSVTPSTATLYPDGTQKLTLSAKFDGNPIDVSNLTVGTATSATPAGAIDFDADTYVVTAKNPGSATVTFTATYNPAPGTILATSATAVITVTKAPSVIPIYGLSLSDATWKTEKGWGIDLVGVTSTASVLRVKGTLTGTTLDPNNLTVEYGSSSVSYSIAVAGNDFYIYIPYDNLKKYAEDRLLNVSYGTLAEDSIPVNLFTITTKDTVSKEVTSGEKVTITGTVAPVQANALTPSQYKVYVWKDGTAAPVTSTVISDTGTFSITFVTYGNKGQEYYVTVQKKADTAYNEAPYYILTVTKLADVAVGVTPDTIVAGSTNNITLQLKVGDVKLATHNVTGTVALGDKKVPFTGTTDSDGKIVVTGINFGNTGVADITVKVNGPNYYGIGSAKLVVSTSAEYLLNVQWPDTWKIGEKNTVTFISPVATNPVKSVTVTVTGPVEEAEAGEPLTGEASIELTPLGYGTLTLKVEAKLNDGTKVSKTFTTTIPGYVATVEPAEIERGATTTLTVVVKDAYGNPVNNALVQFFSPVNSNDVIAELDGTATTAVNNGTYKLLVKGSAIKNADEDAYVLVNNSAGKKQAYIPVEIMPSLDITIALEKSEIVLGPKTTLSATFTAPVDLIGSVVKILDADEEDTEILNYIINKTGTVVALTLPIETMPEEAGTYQLVVANPNHKGTATLTFVEPVITASPAELLAGATTVVTFTSANVKDLTAVTKVTATGAISKITAKTATDAITATVVTANVKGTGTVTFEFNSGYKFDLPISVAYGKLTVGNATIAFGTKVLAFTPVNAAGATLAAGTEVKINLLGNEYSGYVAADGSVKILIPELPMGTYSVLVKVAGYQDATFSLVVAEAEPEYKTVIELAPGMDIYTVNGETKFWDATPYIKNGRTLVPIRHLAEAIGFKASWDFDDPANKMVFIFKADQDPEKDKEHPFILLIIGQPTAMVNGNLVALDVAPEILNGRTMVPLRFVVETLGYKVEWLGNTIRLMK